MLDVLISNGEIIDGTGNKSFKGNIGIKDGLIVNIADEITEESRQEIDCKGKVICPGFIDIHSHSDFTLLINPLAESKVRQGITTEVVGNCGFTPAPVVPKYFDKMMGYLVNTVVIEDKDKKKWKWRTQKEFIETVGENGTAVNIASLVGHGTIRVGTMGFEKRKPTVSEMKRMKKMLEDELTGGVYGMSTGLQYDPGSFSEKDELVEMAKVLSDFDAVYTTHMKSEGNHLIECIKEALDIAALSNVSLEISHLKAEGSRNWGKVNEALNLIDRASKDGIKVGFDVYPYTAFGSGLIDLIPPWARELGSKKMIEFFKNELTREKIINDMKEDSKDWENPIVGSDWREIRIANLKTQRNKKYEGMNLKAIGEHLNLSPYEIVLNLLEDEEGAIKIIVFGMCEEDLITVMKHPRVIFATDGRAVAPYGELGKSKIHPRYYGTYPRILGHYVRDLRIMSLEDAIKKMTMLPALKMNIEKRGELKVGYYADIVIFDKEKIIDLADYDNPHQYSKGICNVFINGKLVVSGCEHTGNLPGRILKRK